MIKTFSILLLLGVSLTAFAQQNPAPDLFVLNDQGLGGLNLSYRGQQYGTAWGVDPQVTTVFRTDANAKPWLEGYQTKTVIGNVLLYAGAASMAVAIFTFKATDKYGDPQTVPSLFTAGLASSVSSLFVLGSGRDDLRNAVQSYNYDLEHSDQAAIPGPAPLASTTKLVEASDDVQPSDIYVEEGWFSTYKLYYRQIGYDTGFGVDSRLRPILGADADLRARLDTSDTTRNVGWGLLAAGAIAWPTGLLTGIYWMFTDGINSRASTTGFTIGISGMLTALVVAPIVLYLAGTQVRSVVADYNARLP
jgi:hypothetical protein